MCVFKDFFSVFFNFFLKYDGNKHINAENKNLMLFRKSEEKNYVKILKNKKINTPLSRGEKGGYRP